MEFAKNFITDLRKLENIDVYIAAFASISVLVLQLLAELHFIEEIRLEIVTSVILLSLAALLLGTLTTRRVLQKLNITVQKLESEKGVGDFLKDRNSYLPLSESLATARQIYLLGSSLVNVFSRYGSYLHDEKLNKQGANIQILIVDPQSEAVNSVAECVGNTYEETCRDIESSLSRIRRIQDTLEAGSIELRLMPVTPNYGMSLIDPDKPHGKIMVEFIGYRSSLHKRPHIELTKHDGEWYEYFYQQYRKLWEASSQP